MVEVIEIDGGGAGCTVIELKAFSPADILEQRGETFAEYRRSEDNMPIDCVVGIAVQHLKNQQTVVQVFDHDGECVAYVGPTNCFVMDPPFDEEPAYDNYNGK